MSIIVHTREPPINGAMMPLNRAAMDAEPKPTLLTSVGKSSELYTYMPLKAAVDPALPIIDRIVVAVDFPIKYRIKLHLLNECE